MATLVVGQALGVETRQAGNADNTWDETVIVVLDGTRVERVAVANVEKFRGTLPVRDEVVALECAVRAYSSKKTGAVGYSYTAFGRVDRVEQALTAAPASV